MTLFMACYSTVKHVHVQDIYGYRDISAVCSRLDADVESKKMADFAEYK